MLCAAIFTVTKLLDNPCESRERSGHIQFQKTKTISTKGIEDKPGQSSIKQRDTFSLLKFPLYYI
jgi:hypothetical protein